VLDGCPAVVAAVGGHVEVRLQIAGAPGTVRIQAPPHAPVTTFSPGEPLPLCGPLRFALSAVRTTMPFRRPGIRIDIASRLSGPDGTTLGLGSSAAVTVAVVAAMSAAAGGDDTSPMWRKSVLTLALGAHRAVQNGLGSGADVAASVYGGVIRFVRENGSLPTVTPLTFPSDTILLAGWTGEPASTQGLVTHYRAAAARVPAVQHAFAKTSRTGVPRQGTRSTSDDWATSPARHRCARARGGREGFGCRGR
jgi:mevalonate kinase